MYGNHFVPQPKGLARGRSSAEGFIALISVIIICAVLLLVVIGSSLSSFNSRFNLLDSELKQRSAAAADACANYALLQLAQDQTYAGGGAWDTLVLNQLDKCRVGPVGGTTQKSFKIQATSSNAVTNLAVTVDASDLSTVSWQEVQTY